MKNTIMLINTLSSLDYWSKTKEPVLGIPLGLLSIGSVLLKSGYTVKIVDPVVDNNYLDTIKTNLDDCLYVGVSVMTAGVASGLQISQFIRELKPSLPIVWGGIHPTLLPEQTLESKNVDFIVWGEGEYTCLELANLLRNEKPLIQIEGLGLRYNNSFIVNKRINFTHPDDLPFLSYELLDMNKYLYRELGSLTGVPGKAKVCVLNTGIGCPYLCTFCVNTHPSQKFRPKSSRRVLAELERIVAQFDPDIIHIQDDLFFVDKNRVFEFFDQYKKRGYHFQWFSLARANYFRDDYLSDKFISQIRGSCLWLGLGIESGSATMRNRLRKEVSAEQINRAVETLARNKVATGYAFMFGMPYETEEEMIETVKLILDIKRRHPEADFAYQLFRPYPGTQLFDEAIELGYKMPQSLEGWASLQDIETGYTTLEESTWILNKSLVMYLSRAIELSKRPLTVAKSSSLIESILSFLIIILLKLPYHLSLRLRLFTNSWGFIVENSYYQILQRLYTSCTKKGGKKC